MKRTKGMCPGNGQSWLWVHINEYHHDAAYGRFLSLHLCGGGHFLFRTFAQGT